MGDILSIHGNIVDRLEAMSILLHVVEAGSLSAAGRRLNVPLPTVSRKVAELEAYLGARIFNRTGRTIKLTDAGRDYVASCRRILDDIAEVERSVAGEYQAPKGDLVVTAPFVFGRLHILPVVIDFLKTYPDIRIRLTLSDRLVDLVEEQVDLAVRIGELPDSSLMASRVGSLRRVVIGSPDYLCRKGTPTHPEDLIDHDIVVFDGLTAQDQWVFQSDGGKISVPIHARLVVNTAETAIDAAIAGMGLTRVISYQVADAVTDERLVTVLKSFEPLQSPVSLIYGASGRLPIKLRAFLDFAVPHLKTRLADAALK